MQNAPESCLSAELDAVLPAWVGSLGQLRWRWKPLPPASVQDNAKLYYLPAVFPAPGKLEEPRVTVLGPEDLGDSTTFGSYPSKSGAPAEELQPLAGNLGRSRGSSRGNHVLEMSMEGELAAEVRPLGARCVSSGEDGGKGDAPAPALPLSRTGGAGAGSLAQQTLELERRPILADMDRHQYGASLVSLTSGVAVPPAVQQSLDLERRLHWDHSHRFSL